MIFKLADELREMLQTPAKPMKLINSQDINAALSHFRQ
jgi:hypothetical protein